ncbi:MAG: hypothetical protein GC159_20480 [Phycisphaera sp.]|nr:hypothetical protein [Phycisphaera sp.]
MSDSTNQSDARKLSPAGAALNRAIDEAWRRKAGRFVVQPSPGRPDDTALRINEQVAIEALGVDFPTLKQRLLDLASPRQGLLGNRQQPNGAFRLRLGQQDICITVDAHPLDQRVDCGVYVPRDYRA